MADLQTLERESATRSQPELDQGTAAQRGAGWRLLLKPLASLRLTVPLFAMATFLTFAGTLAQVEKGIWTVMAEYFRTFFARIELRVFFPSSWDVPGWIPFPGGWLIGGLLFVNLVAAHLVRFQLRAAGGRRLLGLALNAAGLALVVLLCTDRLGVQPAGLSNISKEWAILSALVLLLLGANRLLFGQRTGIVVAHGGLLVLLLSEIITGLFAVEGNMRIREGEASNFVEHDRAPEIAIVDRSHPEHDTEYVIPAALLQSGKVIRDERLPFDVEIVRFMVNAHLRRVGPGAENLATAGDGVQWLAHEQAEISGTDMQRGADAPTAYVRLSPKGGGAPIATVLASYWFYESFNELDAPQRVEHAGIPYDVYLRFGRTYEPYTIQLQDFRHDLYPGTNVPKDFSSFVRIVEPARNVDREVRIWMNHPLRYGDQTFYQSGYMRGDVGTILQVVDNPGWAVPYISCLMVAGGLIVHFLGTLRRFLARRAAA